MGEAYHEVVLALEVMHQVVHPLGHHGAVVLVLGVGCVDGTLRLAPDPLHVLLVLILQGATGR